MNFTTTGLWIACGLGAYLLGALPFGFLLARAHGVDIRKVGSGNIGATNVFRSVSKPLGLLTFALDFGKGAGGVLLLPPLLGHLFGVEVTGKALALFSGAMAIIGHNWTCFLGFKGGKGVATSAGMLVGLSPWGIAIALGVWLLFFVTLRYVSLASVAAAAALAVAVWPLHLAGDGLWFPTVLTLFALLTIWKHRANMIRLRAGTEPRLDFTKRR